jgi:DeoR/GlpR family transcriptional regulator of sugar metabolism
MDLAERQAEILLVLRAEQSATIADLSARTQVSRETIRKDLYDMEERGLVKTIRGGAILESGRRESDYELRRTIELTAKQDIARAAAQVVSGASTVYLDYGTSTYTLAEELLTAKDITIITNTLPIVSLLLPNPDIDIVIPGGSVRHNEDSLYGPLAINSLANLYMEVGFFGCAGIDAEAGLTNFNALEAQFSQLAFSHCQSRYVLADHTKLGVIAANKTCDLADVTAIITDSAAPAEVVAALRGLGVAVIVANPSRNTRGIQ